MVYKNALPEYNLAICLVNIVNASLLAANESFTVKPFSAFKLSIEMFPLKCADADTFITLPLQELLSNGNSKCVNKNGPKHCEKE